MEPIQKPASDEFMHRYSVRDSFPRLLADIGGTNLRFVLEVASGEFEPVSLLPRNAYASVSDAIRAYLAQPTSIAAGAKRIRHAAIAIANPIDGDFISMTNADWSFSIERERLRFGLDTLLVVNDFKALAMAIPKLGATQKRQVGAGEPRAGRAVGLLGAGTGLGVSGLVPFGNDWVALDSEGGHVSFSPANEREAEILRFAWKEYQHVSAERLISGMGLELIYRALTTMAGGKPDNLTAPDITQRAIVNGCAMCDEAVEVFCQMLGTVAGNLALTLGAKGGIYVGGGIVPRLGERFDRSGFRRRFEEKGRFSSYLAAIPTYVIAAEYPTLIGVSALLESAVQSASLENGGVQGKKGDC